MEVGASAQLGAGTVTNVNKENKKRKIVVNAFARQIRWSAFTYLFCKFESPWKVFSMNLSSWSFVFKIKFSKKNPKFKNRENVWFLFVAFKSNSREVPSKFRTLVYLKQIGICCTLFFGRWSIPLTRSTHRYKFEQGESWKWKILVFLY